MWPPRHLLRTIEAVSIPLRQSGASSRARESHGVLPNSRHDPSSRRALELAESAFQLIFREGSRWRIPGEGKGLTLFPSWSPPRGPATSRAPRSIGALLTPVFLYRSPRGVSCLEYPPGERSRTTKRSTALAILLQGVWPLSRHRGGVMSHESSRSTGSGANGRRVISHDNLVDRGA